MARIDQKEDVYYILTYAPDDSSKRGKIKVKVKTKDYKVLYDDNIRADYIADYLQRKEVEIPSIKLHDIRFRKKSLSLEIKDFQRKKIQKQLQGMVNIQVTVKDKEGNILYNTSKLLTAEKGIINISIPFGWIKSGAHDIIVEVGDVFTGKSEARLIQLL